MTRPWLIGELNPYNVDPSLALYPLPEHASGGRLARILGLSRTQYFRAFERRNLCTGKWSLPAARRAATDVLTSAEGAPLVLLGAKVSKAFGFDEFLPWMWRAPNPCDGQGPVVVLPHPSGLNRLWNQPDAEQRARSLVLPLISNGEPT